MHTTKLIAAVVIAAALRGSGAPPEPRAITDMQFSRVCVPVLTNSYAMVEGILVPLQKHRANAGGDIITERTSIVPQPDAYKVHALIDEFVLLSAHGAAPVPTIITRMDPPPEVGAVLALRLVPLMRHHSVTLADGRTLHLDMRAVFAPQPATPADLLAAFRAGTRFVLPMQGKLYVVSRQP